MGGGGFMCEVYTWLHREAALLLLLLLLLYRCPISFPIRSSRTKTLHHRNDETSKGASREADTVSIQRYVRGSHCGRMMEEDGDGNVEYPYPPTPSPEGHSCRLCLLTSPTPIYFPPSFLPRSNPKPNPNSDANLDPNMNPKPNPNRNSNSNPNPSGPQSKT